jgi:hypothetical protein
MNLKKVYQWFLDYRYAVARSPDLRQHGTCARTPPMASIQRMTRAADQDLGIYQKGK